MALLAELVEWEALIFLLGLAAVVVMQLLTGQIKTTGLIHGRIPGRPKNQDQYFSPERLQLLVFTLGAALHYLSLVMTNPSPGTFPPLPATWTAILGGSNAVYLGGKTWARWFADRGSN
jgi:hypothetical protein